MGKSQANVHRPADLEQFKRWCSLPGELRSPKTQAQFAKQHGISDETVGLWKKLPGFWEDVNKLIMAWVKVETSGVLKALVDSAKLKGKAGAQDRKLYLQYVEKWQEEGKIEVPGLANLTESIRSIIERGGKKT